jgi:hypothetical protein
MNLKVKQRASQVNIAVAAAFFLWGMFLVTMPLHPFANDAHAGLTGVIPGLALLVLGLFVYLIGRLLGRLPAWMALAEAVVPMVVLTLALTLIFK